MRKIKLMFLTALFLSNSIFAEVQRCGKVAIVKLLAGPRHGAMMRVSNYGCGNNGWVCLDPDAEFMSANESERLFSFILASKLANLPIDLTAYVNVNPKACNGSYPTVEDVRTPN